jgi:hypothetical protein
MAGETQVNRTPICYAYGRHSTNKQELSQEVQELRTREYWERHLKDRGYGTDDIALWSRRQSLFRSKRSFPCRGQVRGALGCSMPWM